MKELTSLDYCKLIAWLIYHKYNVILNKIQMQNILFICYEQYLVSHNSPLFNDDVPKECLFGHVFPRSYKRYSYRVIEELTVSEKERFLKDKDTLRMITRVVEYYHDCFFPLLIPSEKENMLGKLSNFFCKLNKEGWDGCNTFPIERDSYLNARKIVINTPDSILRLWNVFPSPNGTISFEFKERKIATMSVGNKDFSYVAMKESGDCIMEHRDFNIDKAVDALIVMSNLFGYFT
jgi:hypothetical protein